MNTLPHKTKIAIVSTLAGSNKSRRIKKAIKLGYYSDKHGKKALRFTTNKFLIVTPSIRLGEQSHQHLSSIEADEVIDLASLMINSNDYKSVLIAVHQALTADYGDSTVIIHITQDIFIMLSKEETKGWQVIYDDPTRPLETKVINLSSSHKFSKLNEIFIVDEKTKKVELLPVIKRMADTSSLNRELRETIHLIKHGRFDAYLRSSDEKNNRHVIYLKPNENFPIGDTFLLLGAGVDNTNLASKIDYTSIDLGEGNKNHKSHNINIHYSLVKARNSRYFRDNHSSLFIEMNHNCIEHAKSIANKHGVLYTSNKETPFSKELKEQVDNGIVIVMPWNVIGSNDYAYFNNVIALATQNISSDDRVFLIEYCGFTEAQIDWETIYNPLYQRVMRSNIRLIDELDVCHIYVDSYENAYALQQLFFPNAKLNKLGNIQEPTGRTGGSYENVGRKVGSVAKESLTKTQETRLTRFKKKYKTDENFITTLSVNDKIAINNALDLKGIKAYNQLVKLGMINDDSTVKTTVESSRKTVEAIVEPTTTIVPTQPEVAVQTTTEPVEDNIVASIIKSGQELIKTVLSPKEPEYDNWLVAFGIQKRILI